MNKALIVLFFYSVACHATDLDSAVKLTYDASTRYETAVKMCMENRTSIVSLTIEEHNILANIPYSPSIIPFLEERAFSLCAMEEKMMYMEALILLEKLNNIQRQAKVTEFIRQQKEDSFHLVELEIKLNFRELSPITREKLKSIESLQKPFNGLHLKELVWPDAKQPDNAGQLLTPLSASL